MAAIGSNVLTQRKTDCGTKARMGMQWYSLNSMPTLLRLLYTQGKGNPCTYRDCTGKKEKHLGPPSSHTKTEKVEKAIRAFEKFSHGKVAYANPLQHCIYRLGPLERLVSQSRKQLWANTVGHKSFVRKKQWGLLKYLFLYAENP